MADNATLMNALRNAHNAGDTAAATRIAGMIKAQGAAPVAAPSDQAVPWYSPITYAPSNAVDFAKSAYSAIRHPLDTANGLGSVLNGTLANIPGVKSINDFADSYGLTPGYDRSQEAKDQVLASDIGNKISTSFDTPTHAWNTIATHPIDALMMASPGLGQVGKLAETAGMARTASALGKASEFTNPINLVAKPIVAAKDYAFGKSGIDSAISGITDSQAELRKIKDLAKNKWDAIKAQDVQFPADTYKPFISDLLKSTDSIGSEAAPKSSSFRSKLANLLPPKAEVGPQIIPHPVTGAPTTVYPQPVPDTRTIPFNDVNALFRNVKKAAVDPKLDGTEQHLAGQIAAKIGGYFDGVPDLKSTLADANEMSRRKILAENLNRMKNKSEWYVSGDESGLRNQVSALGKKEGHTFTPEEDAAYKKVVRKEGINSVLSTAGGRLGQLFLHGIGAGVGSATGIGPIAGMIGSGAAHLLARSASEANTLKAIDKAMKTVLIGKDAQIASRSLKGPRIPFNDKNWIKALIAGRAATAYGATPQ